MGGAYLQNSRVLVVASNFPGINGSKVFDYRSHLSNIGFYCSHRLTEFRVSSLENSKEVAVK